MCNVFIQAERLKDGCRHLESRVLAPSTKAVEAWQHTPYCLKTAALILGNANRSKIVLNRRAPLLAYREV